MKDKEFFPYLMALLAVLFWGLIFVGAKFAIAGIPPFLALSLRFWIVAALLLPFFPKAPITVREVCLVSVVFGCSLWSMFWSLYLGLDSAVAIVVNQIGIPFMILLAFICFKETPDTIKIIGITIAIIGTFFLAGSPNSIDNPLAFILMIISAFFWALYSVVLKKINSPSAFGLIAWVALFSAVMNLVLSLIFENNPIATITSATISNWVGLVYTSIFGLILAHGIWGYLMSNHEISKVAPMILLTPIFGVFGGVFLLKEELSTLMIIGTFLMLVGIAITFIRKPKKKQIYIFSD